MFSLLTFPKHIQNVKINCIIVIQEFQQNIRSFDHLIMGRIAQQNVDQLFSLNPIDHVLRCNEVKFELILVCPLLVLLSGVQALEVLVDFVKTRQLLLDLGRLEELEAEDKACGLADFVDFQVVQGQLGDSFQFFQNLLNGVLINFFHLGVSKASEFEDDEVVDLGNEFSSEFFTEDEFEIFEGRCQHGNEGITKGGA